MVKYVHMSIFKKWAGPVISFLFATGLQLSGIQNPKLAIAAWVIAGLWGLTALVTSKPIYNVISFQIFKKGSGLEIKFCDANGNWLSKPPEARFWELGTGMITYFVHGFFRLSNVSKTERTIESAYLVLKAKGKELKREKVQQLQTGERILSLDTTKIPVNFHSQFLVEQYTLQKLVGLNYEKAELILLVEATGTKAFVRFDNQYGHD